MGKVKKTLKTSNQVTKDLLGKRGKRKAAVIQNGDVTGDKARNGEKEIVLTETRASDEPIVKKVLYLPGYVY